MRRYRARISLGFGRLLVALALLVAINLVKLSAEQVHHRCPR